MTPQQIDAMKLALEALEADELDMVDDGSGNMVFRKEQAITALEEVLKEHAMRETQRLGQEIERMSNKVLAQPEKCNYPDCKCPTENPCLKGLVQPEQEPKIGCVNHDCDQCKAQPEQEPVACKTLCELCVKRGYTFCANAVKTTHIYTAPPQRKPLTYCQECMRPNPIDGTDCAHGIKGGA